MKVQEDDLSKKDKRIGAAPDPPIAGRCAFGFGDALCSLIACYTRCCSRLGEELAAARQPVQASAPGGGPPPPPPGGGPPPPPPGGGPPRPHQEEARPHLLLEWEHRLHLRLVWVDPHHHQEEPTLPPPGATKTATAPPDRSELAHSSKTVSLSRLAYIASLLLR